MSGHDHETSSALNRIHACAPSGALTHVRSTMMAATWGSAKHDHMHDRARIGVDDAMARLQEVLDRWGLSERDARIITAQMKKFEWCPPAQAFGEVSLAYLRDGTVVRTVGGRGRYPELEPGGRLHGKGILAGQLDIMWSEPEPLDLTDLANPRCPEGSTLWVGDYKAGDEVNVEPVEVNAQAIANTMMAAKWTGAKRAVPFILFLRPPEGIWDTPRAVWTETDIAAHEQFILEVLRKRTVQLERLKAGEPLFGFNEGQWCKFCPGTSSCEAKVKMMQSVAALQGVPSVGMEMTEAQYAWWAERLSQADYFLKKMREVLKARADQGPIPLGNGIVWGRKPNLAPQTTFKAKVALPILKEEIGEDKAWELMTVSKSAIETAVKEHLDDQGIKRQGAATMRRIFGSVARAGGIEEKPREEYGTFRPAPELEEGEKDEG